MTPRLLETHCEWRAGDVADPTPWTELLTQVERDEIDAAVRHASAKSSDLLDIGAADFPLPTLAARLKRIENDLINGRGFVRIRGVERDHYSNDEMCLIYWGIGMHLGKPWAQNKYATCWATSPTRARPWTTPPPGAMSWAASSWATTATAPTSSA